MGYLSIDFVLPIKTRAAPKAVLLALAFRRNDKTGRCDPSIPGLAEMTCLSGRSVIRAIQELETSGIVCVQKISGARSNYEIKGCPMFTSDNLSPVTTSREPVTNEMPTSDNLTKTRDSLSPEYKKIEEIEEETKTSASPLLERKAFQETAKGILAKITPDLRPATADQLHLEDAAKGDVKAWRSYQCSINPATNRFKDKLK